MLHQLVTLDRALIAHKGNSLHLGGQCGGRGRLGKQGSVLGVVPDADLASFPLVLLEEGTGEELLREEGLTGGSGSDGGGVVDLGGLETND